MIFVKRALLALGVAFAAGPFSRVGAASSKGSKDDVGPASFSPDIHGKYTSKGSKNHPNSSKAHKESTSLFVASAACAQKCISANYPVDSHLLTDTIQQCDAASSRQMWDIVSDGTFVKVKSVGASGDSADDWCLGVVPQDSFGSGMDFAVITSMFADIVFTGDGWVDHDMCTDGSKLGLVSCDHPTAQWYSTDGQLISTFCWGAGLTSFLSVNEGCTDLHLSTTSDGATAISRKETFMAVTQEFVQTIPAPAAPTRNPTYYPTANPTSL